MGPRQRILGRKAAPARRPYPEHVEISGGHARAAQFLRRSALQQDEDGAHARLECGEGADVVSPAQERCTGHREVATRLRPLCDADEALRVGVRQRFEQQRVDNGEDRRVDTDARPSVRATTVV
jgi:hypothetical protein